MHYNNTTYLNYKQFYILCIIIILCIYYVVCYMHSFTIYILYIHIKINSYVYVCGL